MSGLLSVQGLTPVVVRETDFMGCIVCDLLSFVIARAKKGQVWITHHTHPNIVAVAMLKELAAVVVVGGGTIEKETLSKAQEVGVTLLETSLQAYEVAAEIAKIDKGRICHDSV